MGQYVDDKPQFNMAVLFLTRIDKRLDEKDICMATGDLIGSYRILQGIYSTIHFKLLEDKKEGKEINEKIKDYFNKISGALKQVNIQQAKQMGLSNAEKNIRECDILLNDLL